MRIIEPITKQKLSLAKKYTLYLREGPKPKSKQSNKYNLMYDSNLKDKAMIGKIRRRLHKLHV